VVSQSNALVLGGTGANAVSVGIGTATPAYTLDVHGTGNFTGAMTFASGQTFPGVAQLGTDNTFTVPQTINTSAGNGLVINASGNVSGLSANASGANSTGAFGFGGYYGVWGETNSTAANAAGVYGSTNATSGQTMGVYGLNSSTTAGAAGVFGSATGTGTSLNTYGVFGENASSTGVGVYGVGVGPSATGSLYNNGAFGVWGDTNQSDASGTWTAGVVGTADNSKAGLFVNNSDSDPTLILLNRGSGGTGPNVVKQSALLLAAYGRATGKGCTIDVSGTLSCEGMVTAVVPTESGARKVSLYAVQSPENWFEDAGSGQLSRGSARIELDPTFAQTVNTGAEYHVFLTPTGDCKGLYVSQKTATSFEVHELGGGISSIPFDYRIMAKRNGYEKVRLADVTEQYKRLEEQRESQREGSSQRMARSSADPRSVPATPTPLRAAAQPLAVQPK
jgi:hypothetical protein